MLRPATVADAARIAEIYNFYVDNTAITFACHHQTAEEYAQMVAQGQYPLLVAAENGQIDGFVYAGAMQAREAYRWNVEMTIYLRPGLEGHGLGKQLLSACLRLLRHQGYQNAYSCITLPNERSVGLHRRCGFEEIGCWRKAGFKRGKWHDVVWLCLPLGTFTDAPQEPVAFSALDRETVDKLLAENRENSLAP